MILNLNNILRMVKKFGVVLNVDSNPPYQLMMVKRGYKMAILMNYQAMSSILIGYNGCVYGVVADYE